MATPDKLEIKMHNVPQPKFEDLPSPARLMRSALVAVVVAAAIITTVVLPAEYAIDPTGVGRVLGLTEMGEIKQQLESEAKADHSMYGDHQEWTLVDSVLGMFLSTAQAQEAWKDEVKFTLTPGEGVETKAVMKEGAVLAYAWTATGGRVNFDLHAHANGQSVDYERGRGATSGEGSIKAPFAGEHGWFWRNRDKADVTVILKLRGQYEGIVRSK
ncbi:MAG: transmembrane anchor protein [Minwuia sp.]|nr:transmembrane anchor protein [Minwuia sp.]